MQGILYYTQTVLPSFTDTYDIRLEDYLWTRRADEDTYDLSQEKMNAAITRMRTNPNGDECSAEQRRAIAAVMRCLIQLGDLYRYDTYMNQWRMMQVQAIEAQRLSAAASNEAQEQARNMLTSEQLRARMMQSFELARECVAHR